jgi:hypothetical protein
MPAARISRSVSDLSDIRAEQIRLVFTHAMPALLGGLAVACLTVSVLWDVTPSSWLFAWSAWGDNGRPFGFRQTLSQPATAG